MRRAVVILFFASAVPVAIAPQTAGAARSLAVPPEQQYAVGVRVLELEDTTRETPADPQAQTEVRASETRALPTTVYYPAQGAPSPEVPPGGAPVAVPDAAAADGAFPVILFSHGTPGAPDAYDSLLARWAAEGYIAVAPTYPVSSLSGPTKVGDADQRDQVRDARFVLNRVLALNRVPVADGGFGGLLDRKRIGAAGHSMGGLTTLALVSDCCRDRRVSAALVMAGVSEIDAGPDVRHPSGPILFAHASLDIAVPIQQSEQAYRRAGRPKYFLEIQLPIGGVAGHLLPFFSGAGSISTAVARVLDDFLAGFLAGDHPARDRVLTDTGSERFLEVRHRF